MEGDDGKEEMLNLLKLLKSSRFNLLLLENKEVFEARGPEWMVRAGKKRRTGNFSSSHSGGKDRKG